MPLPSTARRAPGRRPAFESLEDRTLPATLFVVPGSAPVDGSHFHDLDGAVAAAASGDVVQVEPGSAPGSATVTRPLTIRGDPAYGPATLPQVSSLTVDADGVTLDNLNLGGVLTRATRSHLTVHGCWVASLDDEGGASSGNLALVWSRVTSYVHLFGNSAGRTNDVLRHNQFDDRLAPVAVQLDVVGVDGSVIEENTFRDDFKGEFGIVVAACKDVLVRRNTLTMAGRPDAPTGIYVDTKDYSVDNGREADTEAAVVQNIVQTSQDTGVGIFVRKSSPGHTLAVRIDGNDVRGNQVGLVVDGYGSALPAVAAGDDAKGAGGNDFHGFTGAAGQRIAVEVVGATAGNVNAFGNLWPAAGPAPVLSLARGVTLTIGRVPTADEAFVQSLYRTFLRRNGSADEIAAWIDVLHLAGPRSVAAGIARSDEAFRRRVDELYFRYLGREADPTGESVFVAALRSGRPEEDVAAALLGSPEFFARAGRVASVVNAGRPNAAFVQALYVTLLGRSAPAAEFAGLLPQVQALGRTAVAKLFLRSTEFRGREAAGLYARLLVRRAAPAELAGWVNAKLDLYEVRVRLAGSPEFVEGG